jgi:integrase
MVRTDAVVDEATRSAEVMLREVLAGDTYDEVARRHRTTRTGVERRIKALAVRIARRVIINGLNEDGAAFVRRLRVHREAVLEALESLVDDGIEAPPEPTAVRILTDDEIAAGARRVAARRPQPLEDLALYYLMLATGARPLEIARLQTSDYVSSTGLARSNSELRAEVAITGRARPLHFRSDHVNAAIDAYLAMRLQLGQGIGVDDRHRGLDPSSRLFLSPSGRGFEILAYGTDGQRRFRCRAIQETYRKIWRYADFKNFTTLVARHTVADRLYARGADETQVGLLLGISERAAVREMFPRRLPTLDQLTEDLV